jgi:RecA/RadA recombinase
MVQAAVEPQLNRSQIHFQQNHMAKAKATETDNDKKKQPPTPQEQAEAYLKGNATLHYNFEESQYYKTPSSSLELTARMGGGLPNGAHRLVGVTTGGKSSISLDFMLQFLRARANRRGLYVKAEGRLPPEMMVRSGVPFVTKAEEWVDGTCLILESNVYECIFGFMGQLIRNNPYKTQYFFVLDSMDMIARQEDIEKPISEAQRVAGGALITSTFLKQTAIALEKRGHTCIFISQVRDEIKGQYEKRLPRQGNASGGHALEHQGTWVLETLPRFKDDRITEGDDKVVGHYCKLRIIKGTNETDGSELRYPIRYGRKGGNSVWVGREIGDMMLGWEQVSKAGSWLKIVQSLRDEVKENTGIELPEQVQGMAKLYDVIEGDPKVQSFLFEKFNELISTAA